MTAIKFKQGQAVIATSSRNAVKTEGRYFGRREKDNGTWLEINIAPKGKPSVLKSYRPAQVVAA